MGSNSKAVALQVAGGLMWIAGARQERMGELTAVVTRVVDELDPLRERDSEPTWLRELPPWVRLDGFDRIRKAHDDLLVTEGQAREEISALVDSPGSIERCLAILSTLGTYRLRYLDQLRLAEKSVHDRLTSEVSAEFRRVVRVMAGEERQAGIQRDRLAVVLHGQALAG